MWLNRTRSKLTVFFYNKERGNFGATNEGIVIFWRLSFWASEVVEEVINIFECLFQRPLIFPVIINNAFKKTNTCYQIITDISIKNLCLFVKLIIFLLCLFQAPEHALFLSMFVWTNFWSLFPQKLT